MKNISKTTKLSVSLFSVSIAWLILLNPALLVLVSMLVAVLIGKYVKNVENYKWSFFIISLILLSLEGLILSPMWEEVGWFVFCVMSLIMFLFSWSGYSWSLRYYSKKPKKKRK